ncbi:hypothetical protein GXM_01920 [Nostoc sphaeroides CCNUC1]|uniref:Uncharacterized protein n=1 Tax=Nostoc sphaeroides CCNUC1 TaxID=2653204 RepID=A0A5P8VVL9_9NOSO|nr:hypothetical protein GXM_01920 [Nostoc sphaeroides CCNUC1]
MQVKSSAKDERIQESEFRSDALSLPKGQNSGVRIQEKFT